MSYQEKQNCVISSLVFFLCTDWHGYFRLKQVCIAHRGVPFMEGMLPMRVCQTRRTLNDSFGAWTFPVSSYSIQVTQSHLSALLRIGWVAFPSLMPLNFCVCVCCIPSHWWNYWILYRGPAHNEMQSVTIYPRLAMLLHWVLSLMKRPEDSDSHFCANLESSGNWRVPNFDFYSNYIVKTIHRI